MDATTQAISSSFIPVVVPRRGRRPRRAAVLVGLGAAFVAALLLTTAVVLVLRGLPPPGRIDAEAYARVRPGMDRAEVETAVGLPPADYRDRAHRPGGRAFTEWAEEAAGEEFGGVAEDRLHWEGNEYSIAAGFDDAGRVAWKTLWRHVPPAPRGPADQVRGRLGW